jgi:cytochrome c biogenesis protein CcdA
MIGAFGLAFVAGLLSILSPCVFPLLPIVFGTAASEASGGPLALGLGVALSFVAVGLFVATIGFGIGLDGDVFRLVGAALMAATGLFLAIPALGERLAIAGGPLSDWADRRIGAIGSKGVAGQFGVGVLLGAVWSPCVGPTLGAASVLAAQGKDLGQVALTMASFGVGAAVPLIAVGALSRRAFLAYRSTALKGGKVTKIALGGSLIVLSALILAGADRALETALVNASPAWLTALTTRF